MAVPTLGTAIFYLTPSLQSAPSMQRRISGGITTHIADAVRQRRDLQSVRRPSRLIMQLTSATTSAVVQCSTFL